MRTNRYMRPPLSKKSFPVDRVGGKNVSREVGIFFFFFFFFFLISFFLKLECTGGGKVKQKCFCWKDGKKRSSRPILAHPAGGQETIFYLRMA